MSNADIFTPAIAIQAVSNPDYHNRQIISQKTCTKIMFRGYEISVAMEGNYYPECRATTHLARTEIRVFVGNDDLTARFLRPGEHCLQDSIDLLRVMKQIEAETVEVVAA